jgi:hypothetical protein
MWRVRVMFVPPRLSKQPDTISLDDKPFMAIYSGLRVSVRHFFPPILIEIGISRQIFIEVSNAKFQGNPSSGSRADTCGQMDGRTDMTLTGAFPNYGNAPKITQTRTDELMETATELP